MTSQRLGGFSDELLDTASQMRKRFPQGTVACLSLCYTDHEHSFVYGEPQKTVLIYQVYGLGWSPTLYVMSNHRTIGLITAFITS